jgi:hypothetical protein
VAASPGLLDQVARASHRRELVHQLEVKVSASPRTSSALSSVRLATGWSPPIPMWRWIRHEDSAISCWRKARYQAIVLLVVGVDERVGERPMGLASLGVARARNTVRTGPHGPTDAAERPKFQTLARLFT